MTCEWLESAAIEMYFYGELDAVERVRVEAHVRSCGLCRQSLEDLHAIRHALAARAVVDAPPAGDWSGFMRRLDDRIAGPSALAVRHDEPQTRELEAAGTWHPGALLGLAATLMLITIGLLIAMRSRPTTDTHIAATQPAAETATVVQVPAGRGLRSGSVDHLERSKLVVLNLATRDPHAPAQDWQYERTLAGTLLSDTRLYRQAALQDGAADVARVMRDLETVLLEASMSDGSDRAALERVQRLIARRDLVVKMQVMASGSAGN